MYVYMYMYIVYMYCEYVYVCMYVCMYVYICGGGDHTMGVGGVFLLEVQYSILKSLISTCVLSYVGSREDWLLDRICES